MNDEVISEEGRRARFAQWEKLGVEAVKQDLATGGYRLVGGPPQVRALAQEWVRIKEAEAAAGAPSFEGDPLELLKAIEQATRGADTPVVLEQLRDLPMTAERARAAFHYLKSKGWIEANFGIFYAARLSAAGHDVIAQAKAAVLPATAEKDGELFIFKPTFHGIGINLNEAMRRLRRRFTKI
jgi:hypothetical protein